MGEDGETKSLTPHRQNPTHDWARIIQHINTMGICFHLRWRCSVQFLTSVKAVTAKPVPHPGAETWGGLPVAHSVLHYLQMLWCHTCQRPSPDSNSLEIHIQKASLTFITTECLQYKFLLLVYRKVWVMILRQFPQAKDFSKISISSFLNSRVNWHPQRVCQRHPLKCTAYFLKINIQAQEKAKTSAVNSKVVDNTHKHTHTHPRLL